MIAWPLEEVVQRARGGDHEAWSVLYARFDAPIRRFLAYRLRNAQAAEDLAQDVWEQAWRKLPEAREDTGATFSAWLFRMATNRATDLGRRAPRGEQVPWDIYVATHHPTQVAPDDPESAALQAEMREEVVRVLAQLHPRYRQILQLYVVLGPEWGALHDVGRLLGIGRGAAKNVLARARRQYQDVVGGKVRRRPSLPPGDAVSLSLTSLRRPPRPPLRRPQGNIYFHRDGRRHPYSVTCGRERSLGSFVTHDAARAALDAFLERERQSQSQEGSAA